MRKPKLRHHKPRGLAFVECGELFTPPRKYLGRWKSEEAEAAYLDVLRRLHELERGRVEPAPIVICGNVADLIRPYMDEREALALTKPNPSRCFIQNLRCAIRPLLKTHATTPIASFGPRALAEVRGEMVRRGWCRNTINAHVHRIRAAFRWGVARELVPESILRALEALQPLREGETDAPDYTGVQCVQWRPVRSVLPYLSRVVRSMVLVQWLTGLRSGELTALHGRDIENWVYRPRRHKGQWRGHDRFVCFGWRARAILRRYMRDGYLFYPSLASKRTGLRERYNTQSYQHAINHGFVKMAKSRGAARWDRKVETFEAWLGRHGIEYWHPHQLRHSLASRVRAIHGLEAAATAIGDRVDAALIYAERSLKTAQQIAAQIG